MLISVKLWVLSWCSANLLWVFSTHKKIIWVARAPWYEVVIIPSWWGHSSALER